MQNDTKTGRRHFYADTGVAGRVPGPETKLTQAGWFAAVIMWFIVVFVLGTIGGIWIKLFWMGWVFAS